jgi:hypothetical protein
MQIKKDIGLQFTVLALIAAFFSWLAFGDFTYNKLVNAIVTAYRPIFLVIIIILAMPPIMNLILQMSSKNKSYYNDEPYYNVLKATSHLIFLVLIILIFTILFAFLYAFLALYTYIWVSWILTSIIILSLYWLLWIWLEKNFGFKPLGFFSYGQQKSK